MTTQPPPKNPASRLEAKETRAERAARSLASAAEPSGEVCSIPVAAARLLTKLSASWSRPSIPASLQVLANDEPELKGKCLVKAKDGVLNLRYLGQSDVIVSKAFEICIL